MQANNAKRKAEEEGRQIKYRGDASLDLDISFALINSFNIFKLINTYFMDNIYIVALLSIAFMISKFFEIRFIRKKKLI